MGKALCRRPPILKTQTANSIWPHRGRIVAAQGLLALRYMLLDNKALHPFAESLDLAAVRDVVAKAKKVRADPDADLLLTVC